MMNIDVRDKFAERLRGLMDRGGFHRQRKKLATDLGISESSLSHYVSGQSWPSLNTLVDLSRTFGVSLDYLVLGAHPTTSATLDYGPAYRHIDSALAAMQAKTDARVVTVSRLAEELSARIDAAAAAVVEKYPPLAGTMTDEETMVIEQYSRASRILTLNLEYDIKLIDAKEVAGRFLQVVSDNLARGYSYQFLMPGDVGRYTEEDLDWTHVANAMRRALRLDADAERRCEFRVTSAAVFVGCGFYDLDVDRFKLEQPYMYQRYAEYISDLGSFGYAIAPSSRLQADAIMDGFHREHGLVRFNELWQAAPRI